MSNIVATQTLNDGQRNNVTKLIAQLDSSDEAYVVKLDPALLSRITTWGPDAPANRATTLRIKQIIADVEDGLTVNLWWDVDGTQPNAKLIKSINGHIDLKFHEFGGLPNNAVAPTGKIALSTEGWQLGSTLSYQLELWVVKS